MNIHCIFKEPLSQRFHTRYPAYLKKQQQQQKNYVLTGFIYYRFSYYRNRKLYTNTDVLLKAIKEETGRLGFIFLNVLYHKIIYAIYNLPKEKPIKFCCLLPI